MRCVDTIGKRGSKVWRDDGHRWTSGCSLLSEHCNPRCLAACKGTTHLTRVWPRIARSSASSQVTRSPEKTNLDAVIPDARTHWRAQAQQNHAYGFATSAASTATVAPHVTDAVQRLRGV